MHHGEFYSNQQSGERGDGQQSNTFTAKWINLPTFPKKLYTREEVEVVELAITLAHRPGLVAPVECRALGCFMIIHVQYNKCVRLGGGFQTLACHSCILHPCHHSALSPGNVLE